MATPADSTSWKRKSWIPKYSSGSRRNSSSAVSSGLTTPTEGEPLELFGNSLSRTSTFDRTPLDSPVSSRPTTPKQRANSSSSLLTMSPLNQLDSQASQLILGALERTSSQQQKDEEKKKESRSSGAFGKLGLGSMIGGLSSLSLSRSSNGSGTNLNAMYTQDDSSRGRSATKDKTSRSASAPRSEPKDTSHSRERARSQSPFHLRRFSSKQREPSPPLESLAVSDAELSDAPTSSSIRPRNAFSFDHSDSDEDTATEAETEDEPWSEDEELFDTITERNTEQNAIIERINTSNADAEVEIDPDPLGEGVNVVVPPEPYFPSTLNSANARKRGPRRRKTVRPEPLPLETSRPVFKRDRCTITIRQGDPRGKLGDRKRKRYVIASDLSEESRYAVEWGIGTVIRDGDELLIVTVVENESKVDPLIPNAADRAVKLRSQQERQGLAYILVRQATSLLQRTKLHVTVACQAWHAKHARHMLLDIVDHHEPIMLIVGSRGLGQIKGILLGSTSHYLIQKCSVPVMVARRRLKRPPRRSAHLSTHRTHVSLAEAGIDRMAAKVDQDVETMRQEVERDDHRREDGERAEEEADVDDDEEDEPGVKVAGS